MVNFMRAKKKEKVCFVCGKKVGGEYVDHVEEHKRKTVFIKGTELRGEEFLRPVIEGDPLLTVLEDVQILS
jgi:hypothetical protein